MYGFYVTLDDFLNAGINDQPAPGSYDREAPLRLHVGIDVVVVDELERLADDGCPNTDDDDNDDLM